MKFLVEFTIPDEESPMTDVSGEADEAGEADEPGEVEGVSTGVDEEEDSEGEMLSSMYVYRNKYSRGVDWYVQWYSSGGLPWGRNHDCIIEYWDSAYDLTNTFIITVSLQDVQGVADPLGKVKPGLQAEGSDVPLQAVHIRAQLIDLAARVVVMQSYRNNSLVPIEAKYVFPLDDMAAVCGFEAFINGKHIVGVVKEKEQAHREYKEAISKGHGAYLMDEETPVRDTNSILTYT